METILSIEKADDIDLEYGTGEGYRVKTTAQTVEMGISMDQSCCESFGYFWSQDDIQEFIGADLRSISIVDTELNKTRLEEHIGGYGVDEGGIMFVNLETDRGVLQFTAYNSHNGYYGHTAVVRSATLNHEASL